MEKTTNYQLNKPEVTDPMRLADFNENADKIDAALGELGENLVELTAAVPKIVTGNYLGNGSYGSNNPTSLTFDFTPKLVMVRQYNEGIAPAMFYFGEPISRYDGVNNTVSWSEDGKTLSWYCSSGNSYQLNISGLKYLYIAFG